MLGCRGVGVDDLLVADLVGVLVVLQVVVRHVRRRVVDAADLAFLADLDLARHRVDGTGRVVDVGDRAGRRHRLQVLVVDAVLLHRLLQPDPILLRRNANAGIGEQLADLVGRRLPHTIGVLVEELTAGIFGLLEAREGLAALDGNLVRRLQRVVEHRVEVDVGEVDTLFGTIEDAFPRKVSMQVHLTESDGVGLAVAVLDGRHRGDVGLIADRGERPDGDLDGLGEVR